MNKRIVVAIFGFLLMVGIVSALTISFSGTIGEHEDTIGFDVVSCTNSVCNEWEDYVSCPEDCEEPIQPFLDMELIDYKVSNIISDDTYENGAEFVFDISFYHLDGRYFQIKIDDFIGGGDILETEGNVIMEYTDTFGDLKVYEVMNNFQEPASDYIDELMDTSDDFGIQSTIKIRVKMPTDTPPTHYSAKYYGGVFQ